MLGRLSVRSGDREMGSKHLTKKQIQNNAGKAKKAKKRADAKELQGTVAPGASSVAANNKIQCAVQRPRQRANQ